MNQHRLADHIEQNLSDSQMENLWKGISARRDEYQPKTRRRRSAALIGSFAVAAGVLLGWYFGVPLHQAENHAAVTTITETARVFEAGGAALQTANDKMSVDLIEGSVLTLAPHTRIMMKETSSADVALRLQEGRVACDVAKDKDRTFSVHAGPVTVTVVGTRFTVERSLLLSGEKILVEVERGLVEVNGPDGVVKRLAAGESWSLKVASDKSIEGDKAQAAALKTRKTAAASAEKKKRTPAAAEEARDAARELFEDARAKRNTGQAAAAAILYEKFLSKYASDGRAGVAALELGRLKMDQLGDPAGALAPLKRAANLGAGGLGDDALARLAQAYSRLGQVDSCKRVRARYLKSHPQGVHVEQVRALCP